MQIVSAVTTCPRADGISYLQATLDSLHAAGFDPLVFDDPEKQGSWPALRNALQSLLDGFPQAEALCVFQDDIIAAKGLCGWLERNLWPADPETILVCSPYTADANRCETPGWHDLNELPVFRPFGACAFIFTAHGARRLLAETKVAGLLSGSDTQVGSWARRAGLGYFNHTPSLIQHVGEVSSLHVREIGLNRNRTAGDFVRDMTGV